MRIDFTIPLPLIEFIVHFIAMMFYCAAGSCMKNTGIEAPIFMFFGIILTVIGAYL